MDNPETERTGHCLCGAVSFRLHGKPLRVGLCHCEDCRRTSGSAFSLFGVWPRTAYEGGGELGTYDGRSFCTACGSRVVSLRDDEAEVMLGSLDNAPTVFTPEYEVWIPRRETWLHPVGNAKQFNRDRDDSADFTQQPMPE